MIRAIPLLIGALVGAIICYFKFKKQNTAVSNNPEGKEVNPE